ncbi:alpha/beta fold hydrolase [Devosia albogilva]|uniref:Alpha/beta fold hydrolase n=1 Tax=Devosia albogilva TaxID=429726 RepID=A0ABW5QFR5_9HYPH
MNRQRFRWSGGSELSFVEMGDRSNPAILLLHGFPSSSATFREVAPALSAVARVIVPDLPGFGDSEPLPAARFADFADAIAELLDHLGVQRLIIYLHDFGAPVGLELATRQPERVVGLVIQNANAHRTGQGQGWDATHAYWAKPTPENEAAATAHLTREGTRDQYVAGVPADVAAKISPAVWEEDWRVMQLPGRMATQRALVADYGRYSARFGEIAAYLREHQPPALLLWGRHDVFFDVAEVLSWMEDLPRMEAHVLDGGHFVLETHAAEASALMAAFIRRLGR